MTTELSELSNNNLEILDKNLDLLRVPDEELSDSGESWYSENSGQGDIFIRLKNKIKKEHLTNYLKHSYRIYK